MAKLAKNKQLLTKRMATGRRASEAMCRIGQFKRWGKFKRTLMMPVNPGQPPDQESLVRIAGVRRYA
jgi:hypothetical protein